MRIRESGSPASRWLPVIGLRAKAMLVCAISSSALVLSACNTRAGDHNDAGDATKCHLRFCDREFSALVFSETGLIEIKPDGYNRFFKVSALTSERVIRPLIYRQNPARVDYAAYRGRLDGRLEWSIETHERWIFISRISGLRLLSERDGERLNKSFAKPPTAVASGSAPIQQ